MRPLSFFKPQFFNESFGQESIQIMESQETNLRYEKTGFFTNNRTRHLKYWSLKVMYAYVNHGDLTVNLLYA